MKVSKCQLDWKEQSKCKNFKGIFGDSCRFKKSCSFIGPIEYEMSDDMALKVEIILAEELSSYKLDLNDSVTRSNITKNLKSKFSLVLPNTVPFTIRCNNQNNPVKLIDRKWLLAEIIFPNNIIKNKIYGKGTSRIGKMLVPYSGVLGATLLVIPYTEGKIIGIDTYPDKEIYWTSETEYKVILK